MIVPRVLLLTDRNQLPPGRWLVETVADCVDAGLTHVVLRELDLPSTVRADLVERLTELPGLTVLTARTAEPGAAGVHLAADQPVPAGVAHGRSCHNLDEMRRAGTEGAAYVTLSPFAETASKPGYRPLVQPDDYAAAAGVPVLALGGITPANAPDAIAAGADGVAVMGSVMRAGDPAATIAALIESVR